MSTRPDTVPHASGAVAPENPRAKSLEDSVDDPRVFEALKEYVAALDAGNPPNRDEFLSARADIAGPLATCLDSLALVCAAAPRLRALPGEDTGAARPAELPVALGDFRIIREIGRGGMGVVYEAEQLSLGRRVALKVLPFAAALDATRLQRFKNEAQAAAQLHHTNIVPVYAVGCDRGVHFYAMQLIEGKTLAGVILDMRGAEIDDARAHRDGLTVGPQTEDWADEGAGGQGAPGETAKGAERERIASASRPRYQSMGHAYAENEPFTNTLSGDRKRARAAFFKAVARLAVQAAEALDHAHQMGVVHRDIKPGNLLIDAHGKLWITDFGLAQFHAGGLTVTGNLPGTIRYMSPEQATGQRVMLDHRTDIYSLGVTLYELLTLEPAFDDMDGRVLVRHIAVEEPRAPRSIDRTIPQDLETILLKAMAKSPGDRYTSAQAMADDFQRFLDHQPIRARRPSPPERMVKWARRHKPLVIAGVLLVFMAAVGFLASTVLIAREHAKTKAAYARERTKSQEAEDQRREAEARFRQARAAVDTFTRLGEEELAGRPMMYQLRRRFLEASLDYYESFLDERPDDPAVQADLAATRERVARIIGELSALESFGPLMLLSDRRVQEELGVSARQRERIEQLAERLWAERDEAGSEDGLDSERRQHRLAELLRSHEQKIGEVLDEAQMHRLREIGLQQQGPFAFKRPEVVAALNLSATQRREINEIIESHAPHRDHHAGHQPGRPPNEHFDAKRDARKPPLPDGDAGMNRPREHNGPRDESGDASDDNSTAPREFFNLSRPPDHGPGFVGPPRESPDGFDRYGGPGDFDRRTHAARGRGDGPPSGSPGNMRETMNRTVEDIIQVLTPAQRIAWADLVGEPVTYDLQYAPDDSFLR
jgi:serine/threonine protein kinase